MTSTRKTRPNPRPQQPSPTRARSGRFWTQTRIALVLTAMVVILAIMLATFSRPETEKPADPIRDAELQALDGESFRLADYDGKVLVLNLWATWCGPCRAETPLFVELQKEYAPRGVEFVGLTMEDPAKDAPQVRDFARAFGVNYQLGWADPPFSRRLRGSVENIPQTFIYARDGRQLSRLTGFNPQTSPAKLRAAIEQALKDK